MHYSAKSTQDLSSTATTRIRTMWERDTSLTRRLVTSKHHHLTHIHTHTVRPRPNDSIFLKNFTVLWRTFWDCWLVFYRENYEPPAENKWVRISVEKTTQEEGEGEKVGEKNQ